MNFCEFLDRNIEGIGIAVIIIAVLATMVIVGIVNRGGC